MGFTYESAANTAFVDCSISAILAVHLPSLLFVCTVEKLYNVKGSVL
jgi:hypothetical protein